MNEKLVHEILTKAMNLNTLTDDIVCVMKINANLLEVHVITRENINHKSTNLMNKDELKRLSQDLSKLLHGLVPVN